METLNQNRNELEHNEDTGVLDPFYMEFKLASDLPEWLKLQHDIRAGLEKLMTEYERTHTALESCLTPINDQIAAYNEHVPNVYLRKALLTADNWLGQYESWQ